MKPVWLMSFNRPHHKMFTGIRPHKKPS